MEIYSLTVLKARSLGWECQQGRALFEDSKGKFFLASPSFWWHPWLADGITPSSAWSSQGLPPSLRVSVTKFPFSYKSFCLGAHSNPVWSHLHLITPAMSLFPSKVTFVGAGFRDLNIYFGRLQFNPQKIPSNHLNKCRKSTWKSTRSWWKLSQQIFQPRNGSSFSQPDKGQLQKTSR